METETPTERLTLPAFPTTAVRRHALRRLPHLAVLTAVALALALPAIRAQHDVQPAPQPPAPITDVQVIQHDDGPQVSREHACAVVKAARAYGGTVGADIARQYGPACRSAG